jgi:Matrixin
MYVSRINLSITQPHESEHADDLALKSNEPYESDVAPFGDIYITKLDNLYVRQIDGVKTLAGKVIVHFESENGKSVSSEERNKILFGFRSINQRIKDYAIDIKFVDASKAGRDNGHERPPAHAVVLVVENADYLCKKSPQQNVRGCIVIDGIVFGTRKIVVKEKTYSAVAAHEFGHFIGLTHNSRENSLMTGYGVISSNSGLSENEIIKLVDLYG